MLENGSMGFTTRALDLLTPIGKGQRCLIVALPKAGKTTLLKDVALAVAQNHPEIEVFVLLVDERPEEVTDFKRAVTAEVFAASSDLTAREHVQIADDALHRALGGVLAGRDVLVLLDSITRLARAYNVLLGQQRPHPHRRAGCADDAGAPADLRRRPQAGGCRRVAAVLGTALVQTGLQDGRGDLPGVQGHR